MLVLLFGQEAGGSRSWLWHRVLPYPTLRIRQDLHRVDACQLSGGGEPALSAAESNRLCRRARLCAMALVALSPDLGGAAMFLPMMGGMLVVAGIRWRFVAAGAITIMLLGAGLWLLRHARLSEGSGHDFRLTGPRSAGGRVSAATEQDRGRIGSTGGQGISTGHPESNSDSCLPGTPTSSLRCWPREWGFLGVVTVLGLYAVYIFNGARVAARARDREGVLLVAGLLSGFTFHVIYNTSMVVGLVPITGDPPTLPLLRRLVYPGPTSSSPG